MRPATHCGISRKGLAISHLGGLYVRTEKPVTVKKKYGSLIFILLGVGIAAWASGFFNEAFSNFLDGVGYSAKKVKFRFKSLTTVRLTTVLGISNRNNLGLTVNSFDGRLRFGKDGPVLAPVKSAQSFQVAANKTSDAEFISDINLFTLGASVQELVGMVKNGQMKKLWLEGNLKTSVVNLPVNTAIGLLEE